MDVGYELVCGSAIVYGNMGCGCGYLRGYQLIQGVYTGVERAEIALRHAVNAFKVRLGQDKRMPY
jgi:hypothetical protein